MCNRDCFSCGYQDCIRDDVTYEEYAEIKSRDREEKLISDKLKWNNAHPDVIKKAKAKYRAKNLEREQQKSRDYYYANRERILERNKTDYIRDYKKKWMREHRKKKAEGD